MATLRIHHEDTAGFALALLGHAALVTLLVMASRPRSLPPVERISVTLQGPIAAEAGAPSLESARPATAPEISPSPVPAPAPSAAARTMPQPVARVAPPPSAKVKPPVPPKAPPREQRKPEPRRAEVGNDFLKGVRAPPRDQRNSRAGGASRLGEDFLRGATETNARGRSLDPSGPTLTPQVRSSLASEVARQLKPHWQSPDGIDVDKLATTIEWSLNPDGSLAGSPRFVGQSGINSANQAQAVRHREQAIRAVRLAAPFNLPPEFYSGWQRLRFTFDWKLN